MVQGTASHVGKSLVAAALCRALRDRGLMVAPFKAQNMALNSFVTAGGAEIGRAQALQALAAGVQPTADMNPILLKPSADSVSQVIVRGGVHGVMTARQYQGFKKEAGRLALESYSRLASSYDAIVIEGAGSPAEVNLREDDFVNMGLAALVDAPVVLVADIDRGGVFASIVGTLELLAADERARVKGVIVNKFRGDPSILAPGLDFLEGRTGKPVLGVMPFIRALRLPEEDGAGLRDRNDERGGWDPDVTVAVIRLPRMSNFTDFDPLTHTPGVRIRYADTPEGMTGVDMTVIPGTKNTIEDLLWLKEEGFQRAIRDYVGRGGVVFGVCGGFQMLGKSVEDPWGVESDMRRLAGLGLLDASTVLKKEKLTCQVKAEAAPLGKGAFRATGYEIHMGETISGERPFATITERNGEAADAPDGAVSADMRVFGTYIHGIFDNDALRGAFISWLRERKGLARGDGPVKAGFGEAQEASISLLTRTLEESVRMDEVMEIMGIGRPSAT
jgi:adenosylcobyric acid synthase